MQSSVKGKDMFFLGDKRTLTFRGYAPLRPSGGTKVGFMLKKLTALLKIKSDMQGLLRPWDMQKGTY